MLVVIAIISILASLLMPALQKSIETAKMTMCANNLKQQGVVIYNYAGEYHGGIPPLTPTNATWAADGYGEYATFMTAIQGYEARKPISEWGQAGGPYNKIYHCPGDAAKNHGVPSPPGGWGKKGTISYGGNRYAFTYVSGKSVSPNEFRKMTLIRRPSLTAFIADCHNDSDNQIIVQDVANGITTSSILKSSAGQNLVPISTSGSAANQGLALRHNETGYNVLFLDGRVAGYQYPLVPDSFGWGWASANN